MPETILEKGLESLKEVQASVKKLHELHDERKEHAHIEKKLEKAVDSKKKQIADEINKAVRERRGVIESTYDDQIKNLTGKKRKITNKRNKDKKAAISDRIAEETIEIETAKRELKIEKKRVVSQNKIPLIARNRFFSAMYIPKGFGDVAIILAVLLFVLFLIPCGIYFIWFRDKSYLFLALFYVITILFFGGIYLLFGRIKGKHLTALKKIRDIRAQIRRNKKTGREIKNGIIKDPDESSYSLGEFDKEISELTVHINEINREKKERLVEFDQHTRKEIIDRITEQNKPELDVLTSTFKNEQRSNAELDDRIADLSLRVTNEYEVYIGKEFMAEDKLDELEKFMRATDIDNIGKALDELKKRTGR